MTSTTTATATTCCVDVASSHSPYKTMMIKRTPKWHLIKSLVVLIVIAFAVLSLYLRQSTTTMTSKSKFFKKAIISSRGSTSLNNHHSLYLFINSTKNQQRGFMTTSSTLTTASENVLGDSGDGDDEDDGNSKICHKVARFRESKCEFVKKNCPEPLAGGLINYLRIRYCGFEKVPFLFFVCGFLWILLLFYLLSDTAETYFCPSLTEISSYLKLSPNVAGVTFLALGNGAPDIASIVAGVLSGSTGFGVGEPIGAGLFVTTCVMAAVTLFSDVKVDGLPFLRDIGTYLFSVVFVFIICVWQGEIRLWHALVCLSIYFVYVSVVVVGRAIHVWIKSRQLAKEKLLIEAQKENAFPSGPNVGTASVINNDESESTSLLGNSVLHKKIGKESSVYYESVVDENDAQIETKWIKEPLLIHYAEQKEKTANRVSKKQKKNKSKKNASSSNALESSEKLIEESTVVESSSDDSDLEENKSSPPQMASQHHDDEFQKWGNLKVQTIHNRQKFAHSLKRHHGSGFFFPKVGLVYNSPDSPQPSPEDELVRNKSFIFEDHFDMSKSTMDGDEGSDIETEDGYIQQFLHWIEWDEKSWFDRLFYLLVSPAILARNLTIPQADPVCWSKVFAVLCPLFMGPFVLFATGGLNVKLGPAQVFPLWALILIITVFISLFILLTTVRSRAPLYHFVFVFTAFASSVIWIYLVANELVAILQSCGIMWQISDGILALTVLAWGNSLGDMVANVVVARQGYPEMAIGACYGGPCMNLLIGLGLSMTAHCLKFESFPVVLEPNVFMSFVFLLASIISAVLVVSVNGFRAPKVFGVFLLSIYVVFMVMSIMIESGLIFRQV